MKQKPFALSAVFVALSVLLLPSPARAEIEVSFSFFQESLDPYGQWLEVGDYGTCWRPSGVGEDWSPYSDGYWAYTDGGWTWVSYEDWGGVTYHYGRWFRVRGEGWVWTPGYEWAPAWVSWRQSDDYLGWAPLPPEARWSVHTGFSGWVDTSYDIGPDYYRFCRVRDFGSPFLAPLLLPCAQNVTIIQHTVNITNITYNNTNAVIFNGGPNFVNINRVVQHPVPALKLVREDRAGGPGRHGLHNQRGNQLAVYAPNVARPADLKALSAKAKKVVTADRVDRGWGRVPDAAVQEQIKRKLKEESKGRTADNAPARPVNADDLSSVPQKADPNAPSPKASAKRHGERPPGGVAANPTVPPSFERPARPGRPVTGADQPPSVPATELPLARKKPDAKKVEGLPREATVQNPDPSAERRLEQPEKAARERPAQPAVAAPAKALPSLREGITEKPERYTPVESAPVRRAPTEPIARPAQDDRARSAEKELHRQQRDAAQAAEARQENTRRAAESARQEQRQSEVIRQKPPAPVQRPQEVRRQQQPAVEIQRAPQQVQRPQVQQPRPQVQQPRPQMQQPRPQVYQPRPVQPQPSAPSSGGQGGGGKKQKTTAEEAAGLQQQGRR